MNLGGGGGGGGGAKFAYKQGCLFYCAPVQVTAMQENYMS